MGINKLNLLAGARRAEGLAVIIDVFRAFSLACYVFAAGVEKIIPVGEMNRAYRLKENNPEYLLIGEREGKIQPGFDYGNSPSRLKGKNLEGKTVIHTTSAGTQGLVRARRAETVITGSFVNAGAVISYIRKLEPEVVSLVSMGIGGKVPADEDELCAEYMQQILLGEEPEFHDMKQKIKEGSGKRFFDENLQWSPSKDFDLCLQLNVFDFVIRANYQEEDVILYKEEGSK